MKKINSKLLLRLAAIIIFLHSLGHTVGFSGWQQVGGTVPTEVIKLMKEKHFEVQGKDTTMADSFSGSGYTVSIFLFMMVCILWFCSNRNKEVSGIILISGSTLLLLSLVEFVFYFPAVAILSLSASLLTLGAILTSKAEKL